MKQGRIYTCTYGSMGEFVREFIKYISPLMHRMKKEIHFSNVLVPRTRILFSPRLTEIALGSILSEFFRIGNIVNISLFSTKSGVAVCVSGKKLQNSKRVLQCIGHIARLHGGRCIVSFCATERKIILTFPVFPNFHPLKLVPCSTELCRLCHI